MKLRVIGLLLCALYFNITFAQQNDELLAAQYFNNKEYEKATSMFEKIYSKGNNSIYIYDNLLSCYLATNNFIEAEKLVKKQCRKNPDNLYFQVDLGYVYLKSGDVSKSEKYFQQLLNKTPHQYTQTTELANAFKKRNLGKKAETAYLNTRKSLKNNTLFCLELAQIYADNRQTGLMLQEYLIAINQNTDLIEEVQGQMQILLQNDSDYYEIKQTLVKLNRSNPENNLYSEMLVWTLVQRGEFEQALVYTRALDKRNKENGARVLAFAELALSNNKFDVALKAYQEIVNVGATGMFYMQSRLGILKTKSKKYDAVANYSELDIAVLINEYEEFLKEFGKQPNTANTIADLADVKARFIGDFTGAISLYKEVIAMPGLGNKQTAIFKLALADLYLTTSEPWESMLLYGQVDKAFLDDPIGQEAKYRNARLSYFLGEFEWAKAQLDVLKTATTQLIANNAIELLLVIQDNTQDSNNAPLAVFAKADLLVYQNQLTKAMSMLDSLEKTLDKHPLMDDVLLKKAEVFQKEKNYAQAISAYEEVVNNYGTGVLGDNALYQMALIYELKLNNKEKALACYEKFIEKYSGSFFLQEVRKNYRQLRGDCC